MVEVCARAVARRVVGEHGAVDEPLAVYVDCSAALVGVVVIDERRLHASSAQVDSAAVARGVAFRHGAVDEVCVLAVHVDARAAVGHEVVKPRAALGIAAADGYAVKISRQGEVLAVHRGEPYHVA